MAISSTALQTSDAKVYKRRLDAWFKVDDLSFVDISDVVVLTASFDVQLFELPVFNDRDPGTPPAARH